MHSRGCWVYVSSRADLTQCWRKMRHPPSGRYIMWSRLRGKGDGECIWVPSTLELASARTPLLSCRHEHVTVKAEQSSMLSFGHPALSVRVILVGERWRLLKV
eukprot:6213115-Pleurochrysis_carterae.AAC.1